MSVRETSHQDAEAGDPSGALGRGATLRRRTEAGVAGPGRRLRPSDAPHFRRSAVGLVALALALTGILSAAAAIADSPPVVTIDPTPTAVSYSSAHVEGSVDPLSGPSSTHWHYEYTTVASPEESDWFQPDPDGEIAAESGPTAVPDTLSGLEPGTEYHVRLVATNEEGAQRAVSDEPNPTFTTDAVAKPSAAIDPVTTFTGTTAHFSGTVNSGGTGAGEAAGGYYFECSPACPGLKGERSIEPDPDNPTGTDRVVSEDVTGLKPNTTYTVTLVVRNAQTDSEGSPVKDTAPDFTTVAAAPTVFVSFNTPESESTVLVRGAVNPRNSAISDCHFAYGPTTAYGESVPCAQTPGSGGEPVPVTARLSGLQPGATYHLRLVADNGVASPVESADSTFATLAAPQPEGNCPNQARRDEQHTGFLPECRAYELVSPPDKNGGDVMAMAARTRAAESGDAIEFPSLNAFGDAKGTGAAVEYISRRDGTPATQGWSTHSIFPELQPNSLFGAAGGKEAIYQGDFSTDLSRGVFNTLTPLTDDPATAKVGNLYLRENLLSPGSESSRLLTACPRCGELEPPTTLEDSPFLTYSRFLAATTPDLGQLLFEARRPLTADAHEGNRPQLYEFDHGALRFVGLVPPEGDLECGGTGPGCEAAPISAATYGATLQSYTLNALSEDGAKAFFTVPPVPSSSEGELYMRVDHTHTVRINASERTDCADHDPCTGVPAAPSEPQPATYAIPSADGTKVFFRSEEQLTDTPGGNLYVYDTTLPPSSPHNLIPVMTKNNSSNAGNSTGAVLGASRDGAYLYFIYPSNLLPGQAALPAGATDGVYVWHEGSISFLGSTGTGSAVDSVEQIWEGHGLLARVSPDGRSFLFTSYTGAGLTGYDHGSNCGTFGGEPCAELYLYQADQNSLRCVSCNPTGAAATVDAGLFPHVSTGTSRASSHLNRPLSVNGDHVFFESAERLLAADTNARSDVYEYNAGDGSLHLISPGDGANEAHFLEASPDGADVFFSTDQPLLGWDADNNADLYDARIDGGFAEPTPTPAPCQANTCQSPGTAPGAVTPGSEGFVGPGDQQRPKACKKGKVRRHGRCMKRRAKRSRKHHHRQAGARTGGSK